MSEELLQKYNDEGHERLGVILQDGEIIELVNGHDDPEFGAKFRSTDLYEFLYSGNFNVAATWHTHPNQSSNLSGEDYVAFKNHPHIDHYVVGNDGVSKYYVDDRGVVMRG